MDSAARRCRLAQHATVRCHLPSDGVDRRRRRLQAGWWAPSAHARPPALKTDGWTAPRPEGQARSADARAHRGGAALLSDTSRGLECPASLDVPPSCIIAGPASQKTPGRTCCKRDPWATWLPAAKSVVRRPLTCWTFAKSRSINSVDRWILRCCACSWRHRRRAPEAHRVAPLGVDDEVNRGAAVIARTTRLRAKCMSKCITICNEMVTVASRRKE